MEKIIAAIYDLLGEEHRKGDNSPNERVKTIMHKLDRDQNGYLSEDEFVEGCLEDTVNTLFFKTVFNKIEILKIFKTFFSSSSRCLGHC